MYSEKNEENSFINIPSCFPVSWWQALSIQIYLQGTCFIVEANAALSQKWAMAYFLFEIKFFGLIFSRLIFKVFSEKTLPTFYYLCWYYPLINKNLQSQIYTAVNMG